MQAARSPITKGPHKRPYSSDSPPAATKQFKQQLGTMSSMDFETSPFSRSCDRCKDTLGAIRLSCTTCGRVFHPKCKSTDEDPPSEEASANWSCRLCKCGNAGMSDIDFMKYLETTPLNEDVWKTCARLVVTTRNLAAEVAGLKTQLGQLLASGLPALPSNPEQEDNKPKISEKKKPAPEKTVLFIGDRLIRQLRMKILAQLPKRSSIAIKQVSAGDIGKIKEETQEFLKTNQQDIQVILHCGYNECLNFKKEELLGTLRNLVNETKSSRTNVSFAMTTVPQFTRECNEVNETLKMSQTETSIEILDLSSDHLDMIHRGQYSYSSEESTDACAKTIARKIASFLGTELKPLRPREPMGQPPPPPPPASTATPRTRTSNPSNRRRSPKQRTSTRDGRTDTRDTRFRDSRRPSVSQNNQRTAVAERLPSRTGRRSPRNAPIIPSGAQLASIIDQAVQDYIHSGRIARDHRRRSP